MVEGLKIMNGIDKSVKISILIYEQYQELEGIVKLI